MSNAEVKPRAFKHDAENHLHDSLRPVNPDNACILRITATAGHVKILLRKDSRGLSRDSFLNESYVMAPPVAIQNLRNNWTISCRLCGDSDV